MLLPRRMLGVLAAHAGVEAIHLVVSKGASQVLSHELGRDRTGAEALAEAAGLDDAGRAKLRIHRDNELDAPISSGSYRLAGTVILPCSSGTLGALATGSATTEEVGSFEGTLFSFGQDESGDLYATDLDDGRVYRLTAVER